MTAAALHPVACGLFLVTAFTLSGLAHTAWLAAPRSRRFAVPLDGGRVLGGRRIFGDHKTVRGLLVMVPATGVSFALLAALLAAGPGIAASGLWPLSPAAYSLLGTWAALGFMAGELPNSFIKRRLGIPPGAAARGRRLRAVCLVADRLDSSVGMLLALALVVPVSWPICLFVLIAGPLVHAAFSVALFRLRVKARAA